MLDTAPVISERGSYGRSREVDPRLSTIAEWRRAETSENPLWVYKTMHFFQRSLYKTSTCNGVVRYKIHLLGIDNRNGAESLGIIKDSYIV